MTTHAVIINRSTKVTKSELLRMAIACTKQLREDACPLWGAEPMAVGFASSDEELLPEQQVLYLFDDADAAGALGYHDVNSVGMPYGKVFVNDILRNGGHLFDGAMSVSVTLSHELLELQFDPFCDTFREGPDGIEFAQEACDACEAEAYPMGDTGIWVSDFLGPEFFNLEAMPGARLDFLGKISKPFETLSGGYQITRKAGAISQVYGFAYPRWKLEGKQHPGARTARRARA